MIIQCYFQLSPGGSPESQIPPEKTPKIQKNIKKYIEFTPRYVLPPEPGV